MSDLCKPVIEQCEQAVAAARASGEFALAQKLQLHRRALLKTAREHEARVRAAAEIAAGSGTAEVLWDRRVMTVELPIHTFSEANGRGHWSVRHKKSGDQRPVVTMAMRALARSRGVDVRPPCSVQLVRLAPTQLDEGDNLDTSMKHVRDGIADWLGVNDRDPRVAWPRVKQEPAKAFGVRIEITSREREDEAC